MPAYTNHGSTTSLTTLRSPNPKSIALWSHPRRNMSFRGMRIAVGDRDLQPPTGHLRYLTVGNPSRFHSAIPRRRLATWTKPLSMSSLAATVLRLPVAQ